jgi:hypothetical protein
MLQMLRTRLSGRSKLIEQGSIENRKNRRHSVLMMASVYSIDIFRDIVIRNPLRSRLMGRSDVKLEAGEAVYLSFDDRIYHSGIVRWTSGHEFGLDLDDNLTGPELSDRAGQGMIMGLKQRIERACFDIPAKLHSGELPRPAKVRNLSRTGLLLEVEHGYRPGQEIIIRVGRHPLIAGRVVWGRDGKIGVVSKVDVPIMQMLYGEH